MGYGTGLHNQLNGLNECVLNKKQQHWSAVQCLSMAMVEEVGSLTVAHSLTEKEMVA